MDKQHERWRSFVAEVRENGAAIERSIQVAAGAIYLTIVGSLASNWDKFVDEAKPSQEPLFSALALSATSVLSALFATMWRSVALRRSPNADAQAPPVGFMLVLAWIAFVLWALFCLVAQGFILVDGVNAARDLALKR